MKLESFLTGTGQSKMGSTTVSVATIGVSPMVFVAWTINYTVRKFEPGG